jgi:hypothetical protein
MDPRPSPGSPLYLLERSDVGIVQLDRELRVVAMNDFARRVLPVDDKEPFDKIVLSFHPERSQPKVRFLIDQADSPECPVASPPPMTMIINIPERVLLIKVSKLADARGERTGFILVFYDITEVVSHEEPARAPAAGHAKRQLHKIPTVKQNRIVLVDADTVSFIRSEGHYTWVQTREGSHFCNLAISDLEERLNAEAFLRIHRSYIANLGHADQIVRDAGRVMLKLRDREGTEIPVARTSVARLMARLGIDTRRALVE